MNLLTGGEILLNVLDGAALSGRVKQQQQNRLQDSDHVVQGQRSNQPTLSGGTYRAIGGGQAVHYNTQRPETPQRPRSENDGIA